MSLESKFKMNNVLYNINISDIPHHVDCKNVGILLAGGFGNRFSPNIMKQMYNYNSSPLFLHSLRILVNVLDIVIIVSNSACYEDIKRHVIDKIYITVNDEGDRLESIYNALCFIKNNIKEPISNLIIHDCARPFINEEHINTLLNSNTFYSQYYLKLTNGLLRLNNLNKYEEVDRNEFIEICTPICVNYKLYEFLFYNYIKKERRICCEIIPLLDLLKIKYELIEGEYKYIRKITKITDLDIPSSL